MDIIAIIFVIFSAILPSLLASAFGMTRNWSLLPVPIIIIFFLFLLIVPQAPEDFARRILYLTNQGGGRSIILTVNDQVRKAWPEIFAENSHLSKDNEEGVYRTKPLESIIFGKNNIYFSLKVRDGSLVVSIPRDAISSVAVIR